MDGTTVYFSQRTPVDRMVTVIATITRIPTETMFFDIEVTQNCYTGKDHWLSLVISVNELRHTDLLTALTLCFSVVVAQNGPRISALNQTALFPCKQR